MTILDRYKSDYKSLLIEGESLFQAIQAEYLPIDYKKELIKKVGVKADEFIKNLPSFEENYQEWYSESIVLLKQLLPDRLEDFIRYYKRPNSLKEIIPGNYTIEDCLKGISFARGNDGEKIAGPEIAISLFRQQLLIVKSIGNRFESSLFDIRQLVQADLFDSEIEAAKELAKNNFLRAAGAIAGVVLERHLIQVCKNHSLLINKKDPGISDLNDILKNADVIDIPIWRNIQYLGDIRNICDHDKNMEPTEDQVSDLLAGVSKILKNLF
jgi:hypothetical protein